MKNGISQEEIEGFIELLHARDNLNKDYYGISNHWNKVCERIEKLCIVEYKRICGDKNSEWTIKQKRLKSGIKYVYFSDHTKTYTKESMKGYEWKNGWTKKETVQQ